MGLPCMAASLMQDHQAPEQNGSLMAWTQSRTEVPWMAVIGKGATLFMKAQETTLPKMPGTTDVQQVPTWCGQGRL